MSKTLFIISKQLFTSRAPHSYRFFTSSTASALDNEFSKAKPFSSIPRPSVFKLIKESLPGGKYYGKPMRDVQKLFNVEYGNILRLPGMFGNPEIVMIFTADDFEKVCALINLNEFFLLNLIFS
jgi:hypothetical protein